MAVNPLKTFLLPELIKGLTLVWIGVEMVLALYRIGPWARPWYH